MRSAQNSTEEDGKVHELLLIEHLFVDHHFVDLEHLLVGEFVNLEATGKHHNKCKSRLLYHGSHLVRIEIWIVSWRDSEDPKASLQQP